MTVKVIVALTIFFILEIFLVMKISLFILSLPFGPNFLLSVGLLGCIYWIILMSHNFESFLSDE